VRIFEECKALLNLGYDLSICTYKKGRSPAGLSVHRIPFTPKNLKPGPSYHRIYLDGLLLSSAFIQSLNYMPDVIHAHLHEGVACSVLQSRLLGRPLIADLQDSIVDELVRHKFLKYKGMLYGMVNYIEKLLVKCADFVICSSLPVYDIVVNKFGIRRCAFLPDCVDTEKIKPLNKNYDLLKKLCIPEDRKIVVYLGSLSHIQGTDILLQAFRILVNEYKAVHLLIMGFPNVEKYRLLAKSLRISDYVTFTGEVDYSDVTSFLSAGDVAVAPKLYTTEGNGKVLLYMSMGLPTVVFDNLTNRYLLGDLGIYAREGDPNSLAKALLYALLNKARDQKLRTALRNRAVTMFSKEKFRSKLLHIYEAVLRI
jgi:glycosyltransferase involved in cell wall biosynthesis